MFFFLFCLFVVLLQRASSVSTHWCRESDCPRIELTDEVDMLIVSCLVSCLVDGLVVINEWMAKVKVNWNKVSGRSPAHEVAKLSQAATITSGVNIGT